MAIQKKPRQQEVINGFISGGNEVNYINDDVNTDANIRANNSVNNNDNINNSTIAIAKNAEKEEKKLYGYRLPVRLGNKIEKLAAESNMGKNEFVIKLLSEVLDKIIIEE